MPDGTTLSGESVMAKSKTETDPKATPKCPLSLEDFRKKAPGILEVRVDGQPLLAEKKEFSTGSFGYAATGKITVVIDGKPVKLQVSANFVAVGSKPQA
jgi:hypothetical protein